MPNHITLHPIHRRMDIGTFSITVNATDDFQSRLNGAIQDFMDLVRIADPQLRERLRPLLEAQALLLRGGIREVDSIHGAEGKFKSSNFKARVVVHVKF